MPSFTFRCDHCNAKCQILESTLMPPPLLCSSFPLALHLVWNDIDSKSFEQINLTLMAPPLLCSYFPLATLLICNTFVQLDPTLMPPSLLFFPSSWFHLDHYNIQYYPILYSDSVMKCCLWFILRDLSSRVGSVWIKTRRLLSLFTA